MISRKNRFHGRGGLRRLQSSSKSVRGGTMALKYAPNERRREYRLAVVVSRKVSKSAVVRNRIRRRLYEHVRILSSNFTPAHDLVLVVYDEKVATMPPARLQTEVDKLFAKARLVPADSPTHAIVEARKKT